MSDAARIAAQWLAVARHARSLAEDAESGESAAGSSLRPFSLPRLSGLGGGAGFGFEGSIGAGRGLDDMKSFEGLTEGFRRL